MGAIRKLAFLAILAAATFFGTQQLGFFTGLDSLAAIDARYGLSDGQLVPAEPAQVGKYEAELEAFSSGLLVSDGARKIAAVKLELAQMQKSMLAFREHSGRISFTSPDCAAAGPVALARRDAQTALAHVRAAAQKRAQLGQAMSFKPITGKDFETTIVAATDALNNSVNSLDSLCA